MVKVTVCGAAGGIGQPLSLLLKLNPNVSELALFDIVNAHGVAADLSHVNTPAVVKGFQPKDKSDTTAITSALTGTDLVIIPAGVPRKPGMTRDDLFNINAGIIRDLTTNIAKTSPKATILIISNPVNSTVPIAAEVLKKFGVFDPKKLFGVTTLDIVRAETFLAGILNVSPGKLSGKISVIGGHSGDTIIPLLNIDKSISEQVAKLSKADYDAFVHRVQYGGDEVVKAKDGLGSATLSMAYAGYRFADQVINSFIGRVGNKEIPDSAFVYLPGIGGQQLATKLGVDFFSVPVVLKNGQVSEFIGLDKLNISAGELKLVEVALVGLNKSITQGVTFVNGGKL